MAVPSQGQATRDLCYPVSPASSTPSGHTHSASSLEQTKSVSFHPMGMQTFDIVQEALAIHAVHLHVSAFSLRNAGANFAVLPVISF